jgi:DNA-binding phage protein
MALSNTQVELLKGIRNRLQRGDISLIANRLGLSREHVSKSLSIKFDFYNDAIVAAAMDVITSREKNAVKNLQHLKAAPATV